MKISLFSRLSMVFLNVIWSYLLHVGRFLGTMYRHYMSVSAERYTLGNMKHSLHKP